MCYKENMMKGKTDYTIKAVVRALKVLEEMVNSGEKEIGVSDLARRVNLEKNNVFRVLATLQLYGYVEQNKETENYRLGPKCLLLGDAYLRKIDPLREKRNAIGLLSQKSGESSYFCVRNNAHIYHVLHAPSREVIRVDIEKCQPFPVDKHVAGKLIEKVEQSLKKNEMDLQPMIDEGNSIKDVVSIAFPVVEINQVSAIVVYIPLFRSSEERVKYITNIGMEIVNELNRKLAENKLE
jgi:DNA-binding IclR family transcriptional regulator